MAKYRISNRVSGHDFGVYEANSPEEALEVMARDAGYDSAAEMRRVSAGDAAKPEWDADESDDLEAVVEE